MSRSLPEVRASRHRPLSRLAALGALALGALVTPLARADFDPLTALSSHDVVWTSPSADSDGSMPIGNGEVGLNVWWQEDGDLRLLIARTDAWDEIGRIVKVGRVRLSLEPSPLRQGTRFRQRLDLARGTIDFVIGEGPDAVRARLWVDAHAPVVHIEIDSERPVEATAHVELWRTERREIDYSSGYFGDPPFKTGIPAFVGPDTLVGDEAWPRSRGDGRVGWFHDNGHSEWYEITARIQGLEGFVGKDPLERRVFGALVTAVGGERVDPRTLRSPSSRRHRIAILTHTEQPASARDWLESIDALEERDARVALEERRARHERWWREFWVRSWIFVDGSAEGGPAVVERNDHPLRAGFDQDGANRFIGEIGRVSILPRGLTSEQMAALAKLPREEDLGDELGSVSVRLRPGRETAEVGRELAVDAALSIEAWIRPERLPANGRRIVDKITPGGSDGFLFDTFPGEGLRLVTSAGTVVHRGGPPLGRWSHVGAVADSQRGVIELYLNGRRVAAERIDTEDGATAVTRGYVLQRWITACAGRGALPIKFNGSLFTVPYAGGWGGDPDYRRWGSGYWWQNTRLPYISACASGDFDLMQPLFRMYTGEHLEVAKHRNRHHLGLPGAFYNECVYFWGHAFNECYGVDRPEDLPDGINVSGWHRYEFTAGYELLHMMLDYHEHTLDDGFLTRTVIPFAREILTYFDTRYETDADGEIVIHPAQALETFWDATNPMPDVAGLTAVTTRLLTLPDGLSPEADRALWRRLLDKMPELPTREVDGRRLLAPAERYADERNVENPELYAVFPFGLVAVGRPGLELGREALRRRKHRGHTGWRQDDIFMAYLGLAEEARDALVARARSRHQGSRFPAFWGPNYDWVPDQDHGGVLMKTLQSMLLRTDGRRIHLLPAWPDDWRAEFRLHAPFRTTLEGRVEDGRLTRLVVEPPERRADVVVLGEREEEAPRDRR